jgi:biopolymer transport protein ExbD
MSVAQVRNHSEPLGELNTTPLIDILLVLLIMLIFALPPRTNTLSLPLPSGVTAKHPDKVRNVVAITANDAILWNGQPVSEAELNTLLREAVALRPEPAIELAPDGRASYEQSARVLRLVKLSGTTRLGFVGNERYRSFAH